MLLASIRVGGTPVEVRHAESDDVDALVALYEGLSESDRRRRFFSAAPRVRRLVERLLLADEHPGVRLVASRPDGELVADAGFMPITEGPWTGDGEFDLTVAAPARGWFGSYLLDVLVGEAARAGVRNLQAFVLRDNTSMLAVVARRGYVLIPEDDVTAYRVAIGARHDRPVWPDADTSTRVVVESRDFSAAGATALLRPAALVIGCPGPADGPRARCPVIDGEPCALAAGADEVVHMLGDDERSRAVLDAHPRWHARAHVEVRPSPEGGLVNRWLSPRGTR